MKIFLLTGMVKIMGCFLNQVKGQSFIMIVKVWESECLRYSIKDVATG